MSGVLQHYDVEPFPGDEPPAASALGARRPFGRVDHAQASVFHRRSLRKTFGLSHMSGSRRTRSWGAQRWSGVIFLLVVLSVSSGCSTFRPDPEERRYSERLMEQDKKVNFPSDASLGEKIGQLLQAFTYVFASTGGNTDHQ